MLKELRHANEIAMVQLKKHGLWQQGWRLWFENIRGYAGQCYHAPTKRIYLNFEHFDDWDDVMDTILHEIAHALVGPGHGHGPVWKAKARELGVTHLARYEGEGDTKDG